MYSSSLSLNIIVSHGNVGCLATSHKILLHQQSIFTPTGDKEGAKIQNAYIKLYNMYIYILCKVAQFAFSFLIVRSPLIPKNQNNLYNNFLVPSF